MLCFRQGKLFYVTSTTVTSTHTTSTLCFMKQSCQSSPPFDTPGGVATPGGGAKMCSTGCGCAVHLPQLCVLKVLLLVDFLVMLLVLRLVLLVVFVFLLLVRLLVSLVLTRATVAQ